MAIVFLSGRKNTNPMLEWREDQMLHRSEISVQRKLKRRAKSDLLLFH